MKAFYEARDGKVFNDKYDCLEYETKLIIKEKFKMYDIHGNITNDYDAATKIDLLEDLTSEEHDILSSSYRFDYLEDIDEKGFYIWSSVHETWLKNGEFPKKQFEVECNITKYITVTAEDEDEAERIVQNMDFDDIFDDKEFEIYDVEEVE